MMYEFIPSWAMLLMLGISLLISASLTLAKVVFGNLAAQKTSSLSDDQTTESIHEIVENTPFYEIISLGRLIGNSTSAILVFLIAPYQVNTPWPWLHWLLQMLFLWFSLYALVIIAPTILGNLRPNSLASLTLFLYRIVSLPFRIPAGLALKTMEHLYAKAGHHASHRFLTEDQRDLLESDSSANDGDSELQDDEKQMIRNIFEFGETTVSEVMTPLANMMMLPADAELEVVVKRLNQERHSRIPVYGNDRDDILGILHNRDFLQWYTERKNSDFQLSQIIKPALFVPSMKKIDEVLRDMRRQRSQLAIVIDEYGGTAGLVTIEDILEEIVGEIHDEDDQDEVAAIVPLKDGKLLANPLISLDDFQDALGIHLNLPEDSHLETLSGLVQNQLGTVPTKGAVAEFDEFRVRVIKVEDTKMVRLLIEKKEPASES